MNLILADAIPRNHLKHRTREEMNKKVISSATLIMVLPFTASSAGDAQAGDAKASICTTPRGRTGISGNSVRPNLILNPYWCDILAGI